MQEFVPDINRDQLLYFFIFDKQITSLPSNIMLLLLLPLMNQEKLLLPEYLHSLLH